MKRTLFALTLAALITPGMLEAQSEPAAKADAAIGVSQTTLLRDRLMLAGAAATLAAPAPAAEIKAAESQPNQPALMQRRGSGVGYMIAGAALFVAGLLIEGDAGTFVAVAGAAVGAYGLYLHFR
ncbi:MAG: hypothetical protein ACT4O1_06405 [Gemmatimonadota bacterium]